METAVFVLLRVPHFAEAGCIVNGAGEQVKEWMGFYGSGCCGVDCVLTAKLAFLLGCGLFSLS
jgi:hypothetical protein